MTGGEIKIAFEGPFTLTGANGPILFECLVAQQSGVYLWTVPYVNGGLLVTYVGETGWSFARRMKDHAIQTLGGNYRISDTERLSQGLDEVLWNGLWRRGTRHLLPEFVDRYVDLAPVIKQYLAAMRVFVAPLEVPTRVRRRIEAALAKHIWSQPPPVSSLLLRDIRFGLRRDDEEAILVHVSSQVHVLGLPDTVEV